MPRRSQVRLSRCLFAQQLLLDNLASRSVLDAILENTSRCNVLQSKGLWDAAEADRDTRPGTAQRLF